jgi:hypothetical protein
MTSFNFIKFQTDAPSQGGAGGAYKPPSMRVGANQASTTGKKMDFGKGPLNKGKLIFK